MIGDDFDANVTVPDLTTDELQKLQPLLQRAKQATDANALIVGVGHRSKFGAIVADACH